MNTLIPSAVQTAVNNIYSINNRTVSSLKSNISQLERVLSNCTKEDKTKATLAEIVAAAPNNDFANLADFIASLKGTVNLAAPGTYTV